MTKVKIVIGANYGDEGKGLMTDYFAHKAYEKGESCLVVCSNGGSQRGHTVTTPDGKHHVFHHFGSGTFAGADTYLSEKFILNPMNFAIEYKELSEKLENMPKVYVNRRCLCTTPFEMMINQIAEEARGDKRHGSCGCGIWETIVHNGYSFNAMYISMFHGELRNYLLHIRDEYLPNRLKELGVEEISDKWKAVIFNDQLIEKYIEDFTFMASHINTAGNWIMGSYENVIFENGQGLLLNHSESNVHTTPSYTGVINPNEIITDGFYEEPERVEVCYVTRPYLTRHGAGPFREECNKDEIHLGLYDETNVFNVHQGELRYGRLDPHKMLERIRKDFNKIGYGEMSIAFTHMNEAPKCWHTSKYDRFLWSTEYKSYFSNGKTRNDIY